MTALSQAISAALLHFVWQGLLVAVLLFGALAILRAASPGLRYGVCCAALAGMMILPVVTAFVVYRAPAVAVTTAHSALRLPDPVGEAPTPPNPFSAWVAAAQAWTLPIWFAGVFFFAIRLFWSYQKVSHLQREGETPESPLLDTVARLAGRMGITRPVRAIISRRIDAPGVVGWLRPVILIPAATLLNLSAEQLEAILAHELAHIGRHDYLVNVLQNLGETLLFYQPAVWWVSSQIRRERELCCDDAAVQVCGDAAGYARALTRLEHLRVASSELAMSSTGGPLLYRIQRLAGVQEEQPSSKLPAALAFCFALLCLLTNLNWAHAQPQTGQETTVRRDAIWVDTVKYGDFKIQVRALGTVNTSETVELQVVAAQASLLELGQPASVMLRRGLTVEGKLSQIPKRANEGTVPVIIALSSAVPEFVNQPADGTITVRSLNDIVYVGRPAMGKAQGETTMFRVDSDGNVATRVKVRFGGASVTSIQVLDGLKPGDRVILSDTSRYDGYERLRLE